MSYNGYKNYETWNVCLWIDNDQGLQEYWGEIAQEVYDDAEATSYGTKKEMAISDLAKRMKDDFQEQMPELDGMWADLLGAALSEVDWHEVAETRLEDVEEDEEGDEG